MAAERRFLPGDRLLLTAALFWVVAARTAMLAPAASFPRKQRALDRLARSLPRLPRPKLSRACWAVSAVARRMPGTVCLPWTLALRGLLAQAGVASELRIGVAAAEGGGLGAHAWLECEGQTLTWNEAVDGYSVLSTHLKPGKSGKP